MRIVYFAFAIVAVVLALSFLILAVWTTTRTGVHLLRSDERTHVEVATRYIETFDGLHARLPNNEEFAKWVKQMDAQGFEYKGNGYFLHGCGYPNLNPDHSVSPVPPKFCLGFSTGNAFVTYQSWQNNKSVASIDDSSFPLVPFLSWLAAVSLAGFSAWLLHLAFAKRAHATPDQPSGKIVGS